MSFLTIPSQEGLFTTIKTGKAGEEADSRSRIDDEDNNDDDDEDDDTDVHLIPRCSPVPRKRGASIYDETAEYMRIHLALSAGKRVSFADTTGGDLVDVKEFVAFDSDEEEENSTRWEEEEAKYRKPEREPTYRVQPEFNAPSDSALLQAVHTNKVEVEQMSPVENEPLAFSGVIRVLNISFHKAVYIRSTMDNWASYFDHPADYVQGSNDGDTDQFTFKLSFAPPYMTHGSRIEFVVRYETPDGDYWANNSSMNYVVTLLLSYEDASAQTNIDMQQKRGILKPPKDYSMNDDFDSEDEQEKEEEEAGTSKSGLVRPTAVCPVIIQPEIDVEIAVHPSGPPVPPNQELPSVDGTLSAHTVSPGEQFPCMSSETTLQTNSSFVLCASESVQPNKSQALPRLHCELGNQTSEQPTDSSPSALLPASTPSLQQESRPRSDSSQAGAEEIPPSEAPCVHLPTTETNLLPATGEDGSTDSPASRSCLELPAECVSAPNVTQGFEQDVAVGLSELAAGISEDSTMSATHHEGSKPAVLSPVAESEASLGAEGEAPPSPKLTENPSVSAGITEVSQNLAPQSADAPQISPDTLLENLPNTLSEVSELQSEHNVNRNLMSSVIFLSGVVSLSIVLQEPSALFLIGLLLVLRRL
ncbi:protein phosphatase 1 regulatory subunit 3A isoform X2 [Dicentrarchus labrax]|uniref:protein phosphatase 1 regulatory subunit 3A isoform X2 n=1 Tax=Dicentrarchus labrax TaxID=13489 RepID=UPI0021F67D2E|nr:protein phosphatase 1 regulatory subunit 3A isoform X2 [Dicentrarchus labrax]